MSYNYDIKKKKLSEITRATFKEAIELAYKEGITSVAPLGCSGDTIIIHQGEGNNTTSRQSQVSIRNYGGDAELLITDMDGNFLFYGRFRIDHGKTFVINQYWRIFNLVKDKIETIVKREKKLVIADHATKTIGFEILKAASGIVTF